MKEQEINIAIAELLNWKHVGVSLAGLGGYPPNSAAYVGPDEPEDWRLRDGKPEGKRYYRIPNYYNDLNAIHEAEKVLVGYPTDVYCTQYGAYLRILAEICENRHYAVYASTSQQRCEALLKTLNL